MTVLAPPEAGSSPRQIPLDVEIIVPVYNEAPHLAERITELRGFLDHSFPFRALVTVVDNASTDETFAVATDLASTTPGVAAVHLPRKGRGYALRTAWMSSTAPVVAYMDVDLSTSLSALLPLVAPLLSGQRDVAIGTRLARGSHVIRGPKRELISRAYNLLLRLSVRGRFSDAQCGFKALRRESALQLLPLIKDDEWFFDTELLVTAQRLGMRISEVPVDWVDDPDSRVQILSTALNDLRGVWRISHGPARRVARQNATTANAHAGRGRPAPPLRRSGCHQHVGVPLPLHRVASRGRNVRGEHAGVGHLHHLQHRSAPGALPQHERPCAQGTSRCRGSRSLRRQPDPDHSGPDRSACNLGNLSRRRASRGDGCQCGGVSASFRHPAGLGLPACPIHHHDACCGDDLMTTLTPPPSDHASVGLLEPPVDVFTPPYTGATALSPRTGRRRPSAVVWSVSSGAARRTPRGSARPS